VTVFHPVGSGEEVEVEVVEREVGAVFELVVPEHAAKPTLDRQATPTNIHRTGHFDVPRLSFVPRGRLVW
jgi:hypothetical protein